LGCSRWSGTSQVDVELTHLPFLSFALAFLQLGRKILTIAAAALRPGITTDEIDAIVHAETLKRDAYRSSRFVFSPRRIPLLPRSELTRFFFDPSSQSA